MLGSTLILTWIPNSTLKRNPRSIENSPAQTRVTPRRSPRQEYAHINCPTSSAQSPTDSNVDVDVSSSSDHQQSVPGSHNNACTVVKEITEVCGDNSVTAENGFDSINNVRPNCTPTNTTRTRVGVNVNPLRDKCTNLLVQNKTEQTVSAEKGDSMSDGSRPSAIGAARQLAMLSSRSDSSNKSVASVEMDGDNLVIVTEEIVNDDAFVDAAETCDAEPVTVLPEQYKETLDKLTAAASKSVGDNMQQLRRSLDLQLNLTQEHDSMEKVSDFDFEITPLNTRTEDARRSSSSTSGPDTTPPSPSDIPDIPSLSSPEVSDDTFESSQCSSDFVKHCMSFPENSVYFTAERSLSDSTVTYRSAAEQVCGVFSVDLGKLIGCFLLLFPTSEMSYIVSWGVKLYSLTHYLLLFTALVVMRASNTC